MNRKMLALSMRQKKHSNKRKKTALKRIEQFIVVLNLLVKLIDTVCSIISKFGVGGK